MAINSSRRNNWTLEEMASTGLSRVGMKKLRVLDLLADDTGRENLKCPFELNYFYGEGFNLRDGRRKNIIFIPGGPGVIEKREAPGDDRDLQCLEPNHNIIYFHVRGSGLSKIPSSNKYDRFLRADYVAEDVERLRRQILGKATPWDAIIAHSHGTVIAQRYAYKFGVERVKRLVLAAPAVRSLRDTRGNRIQVTASNLQAILTRYRSRRSKEQLNNAARSLVASLNLDAQDVIDFTNDFCFLNNKQVKTFCSRLQRLSTELERRYFSLNFVIENYSELVRRDRLFSRFEFPECFYQAIRELQFNGIPMPGVQFKETTKTRQIHAAILIVYYLLQGFKDSRTRRGEPKFAEGGPFFKHFGTLSRGFYRKRLEIAADVLIRDKAEVFNKSRRAYYVFGIHDGISRWFLKLADREVQSQGFFKGSDIQRYASGTNSRNLVARQLINRIGTVPSEPLYPWHPGSRRHEVPTLLLNGEADAVTAGAQAEDFFEGGIINKKHSLLLTFPGVGHLSFSLPILSPGEAGIENTKIDPIGILVSEFLRERTTSKEFLSNARVRHIMKAVRAKHVSASARSKNAKGQS